MPLRSFYCISQIAISHLLTYYGLCSANEKSISETYTKLILLILAHHSKYQMQKQNKNGMLFYLIFKGNQEELHDIPKM